MRKRKGILLQILYRREREVKRSSRTLNLVRKKVRESLQKILAYGQKCASIVFASHLFLKNEQRRAVVGAHFFISVPKDSMPLPAPACACCMPIPAMLCSPFPPTVTPTLHLYEPYATMPLLHQPCMFTRNNI